MGAADFYKPGDWNLRCSECDLKIKASQARKRWDGFWVCWQCDEIRNPQDFVRGIRDDQSVPYSTSSPPFIYAGSQGTQFEAPTTASFVVTVQPNIAVVQVDGALLLQVGRPYSMTLAMPANPVVGQWMSFISSVPLDSTAFNFAFPSPASVQDQQTIYFNAIKAGDFVLWQQTNGPY